MSRWSLGILTVTVVLLVDVVYGHADVRPEPGTVYIAADAQTWRSKGRVSFPLVPSLRNKLVGAGFTVVPEPEQDHALELRVTYREERGREIRFDLYATTIVCHIRLLQPDGMTILDLTIQEFPPDDPSVTAPYTDVVNQLETNPYYYFLGEIVRERIVSGTDVTGGLIKAFSRLTARRDPVYGSMAGSPPNPGDTLPPAEELYVREVRANTMRELARLKDQRAVSVLMSLLDHPEWRVRRNAINALAAMDAQDARASLERVAKDDPHQSVREAAQAALSKLVRS